MLWAWLRASLIGGCAITFAACGTGARDAAATNDDAPIADRDGGESPVTPGSVLTARAIDVGRYWAHVSGMGTTTSAVEVWFEHKPHAAPTWSTATKSPRRALPKDADLTKVEAWLSGLAPETAYDVRTCAVPVGSAASDCDIPGLLAAPITTKARSNLRRVIVDPASPRHFKLEGGGRFVPWGNNYVDVTRTGQHHQMIEKRMRQASDLALVDADLARLANLAPPNGATNVIRMHLQLHEFLLDALTPNTEALARYAHVVEMAEDRGLYVMVTGLNYFYPGDNPRWIAEQTDEEQHWRTQETWWNAMARALVHSPGVFAYDLMNEPFVSGAKIESGLVSWSVAPPTGYCAYGEDLANGVHGTCFTQYITPSLGDRQAKDVAAEWARRLVRAIRFTGETPNDARHLVTIGAAGFGLANPFQGAIEVHRHLDFLSPHLYPEGDDAQITIDLAASISALTDKPVIAGETFTFGPVDRLIRQACNAGTVQGWIGQYDGRVLGEPCMSPNVIGCALYDGWYAILRDMGPVIRAGGCPPLIP